MRIAVVGAGISGLVTAYLLARRHEVHVFEALDAIGGHTRTERVSHGGKQYAVDTGFIVFNTWTYPNFTRLMQTLGVASRPTRMSFGVWDEPSGIQYAATTLAGLYATRRARWSPSHHRMVLEILRFSRTAQAALDRSEPDVSLRELLDQGGYGEAFRERFVVPMAAAIWSADRREILDGPARFFLRFFEHHAMLSLVDQPVWRTIVGGSQSYLAPLTARFHDRIALERPVRAVRRRASAVELVFDDGPATSFDQVVLACHSDQSLALLADPSSEEREVLGALRYQENEAVLHTDDAVLPPARRARAAWNYHVTGRDEGPVAVTYDMNRLQGLKADVTFCVTLNRHDRIDPRCILRRTTYHHPVFDRAAVRAQSRFEHISGVGQTHYAGAYWYCGFHEDGVRSALRVARRFGSFLQ